MAPPKVPGPCVPGTDGVPGGADVVLPGVYGERGRRSGAQS